MIEAAEMMLFCVLDSILSVFLSSLTMRLFFSILQRMPIIGSAIKKLRQDKKRQSQNLLVKKAVKEAIKIYKRNPNISQFSKLDSLLSRGVKKNIFHANKASRLKSRLSKLIIKRKKTPDIEKTSHKNPIKKSSGPKKTSKVV